MNRFLLTFFVLVAALAFAPSAMAHEYWIAPSSYTATPGKPIAIGAMAGTGFRGEWKPWSPTHGLRLMVRGAKMLDLSRLADPGETTWARFSPSDDNGALVAYVSDFTPITLDADLFDRYLADEGLRRAAAARASARAHGAAPVPGRERYRRCAKAWLAGADAERATTPLGLPREIVPASVPGASASVAIRVLRDGRPLPGALVKAWHSPLAAGGASLDGADRDSAAVAFRGVTDAQGALRMPVAERGEWLVSAVDMVPSADRAAADWESTWASLTFARP